MSSFCFRFCVSSTDSSGIDSARARFLALVLLGGNGCEKKRETLLFCYKLSRKEFKFVGGNESSF